jgi:hypothetical protein
VGAAVHRTGDRLRVILSATAAAAALYGAVVLFGLGPTSPVALGEVSVRPQPVVYVRVRVHEHAVPGPAQRRPQASPGRAQHHHPVVHVQTAQPAPVVEHAAPHVQQPPLVSDSAPPAEEPAVPAGFVSPAASAPALVLPPLPQVEVSLPQLQLPG